MPRPATPSLLVLLTLVLASARAADSAPAAAPLPETVSFNQHIRPIMADACFHCHGFDAQTRKARLRLDVREEALRPAKSGAIPIVPGRPDQSELLLRIADPVDPMPPADHHKALTAHQQALLRRWIEQGARYETHWAYAALERPAVPTVPGAAHPIDAFIRARLAAQQLTET